MDSKFYRICGAAFQLAARGRQDARTPQPPPSFYTHLLPLTREAPLHRLRLGWLHNEWIEYTARSALVFLDYHGARAKSKP